jgi:diacylglycerol kinase family enzyme
VTVVAVVANSRKSLGGGLPELREALYQAGVTEPLWYEVSKTRKVAQRVRAALDGGADVIFVWGGDGAVRAALAPLVGGVASLAIVPAGTANLLAVNLGIPRDIGKAVQIGLHGRRRRLDVGIVNGEHFAVMAGAGFDALMIRDTSKRLKGLLGPLAYVWTGARNLRARPAGAHVEVDGKAWFEGFMTCVLLGNVGRITGGIRAFPEAAPDDGWLEVGVVTARGTWQWLRTFGRLVVGRGAASRFVEVTRGREVFVALDRPLPYELDGDDRPITTTLRATIAPQAVAICVPE